MSLPSREAIVVAVAAMIGCAPGTAPDVAASATGTLGRGSFHYVALSDGDVAPHPEPLASARLGDGGADTFFLAEGARFGLVFSALIPGATYALVPASTTMLRPDGDGFFADRHGLTAIVARGSADSDFLHLEVHVIASLALTSDAIRLGPLHVGGVSTLQIDARDANGAPLAGSLPLRWTSSHPDVATLEPTASAIGARRRVVARAPGRTVIVAALADHEARLEVEVVP